MAKANLRSIENIETNDMNFKHLETTKDIVISPKNEYGDPQRPDTTHTWTAKVSDGENYVGDYKVKVNATSLIVDSEGFTKLPVGQYQLEVWEQWTDPDGTKQLSIYPSPSQTIHFQIYANVTDQATKEIKQIGFQDVIDQAVMNIGMNYVFKVNTIEPDQNATVVQAASDGKNYVTFNIPRGQTGERGFRGPAGKDFQIKQTFASVKAMEDSQGEDFDDGDFALIASNTQDPDNSKLYVWNSDKKQFIFMSDLSGAQGIQGPAGPAPTLHVTKVTTVPNGGQPSFTATPVGNGNYNIEIGLPKGDKGDTGSRGYNFWAMKMTAGGNVSGRYITDLYNASASNLPEVNDLVVQPDGNVYSVTNVVKDTTPGAADGGGTFNLGSALFSIKGDQNEDFYKPGKMTTVATGAPYDDLNTFPLGQTVTIAETPDKIKQIKNLPPLSNTAGGLTVRTESSVNDTIGGIQIAIDDNNVMYHRICWGASGHWGTWRSDSVDEPSNTSNNMILPTLSLFQKVGVVGDSYASGELAFDGKYVDHYEISWLQILARKDGFTGTNFSSGGMSTRTWLTNPNCMPLMQSSDAQDLYILALGINDKALGTSYIGSKADIDNGADTFYGNYGKIIKAIQAKAPQAKLVIATIADSSDLTTKFNEAITTIANHFTIPVIVQLDDPLFNSSFYKNNMIGGHPTGPVYSSMAEAFERLIGQSMIDHLDYYWTFKKDA